MADPLKDVLPSQIY